MKISCFFFVLTLAACNTAVHDNNKIINSDTTMPSPPPKKMDTAKATVREVPVKTYFNKRFRDVTVTKVGPHKFLVSGEAQIFEANFNWVIEDGHEELLNGYAMTDAGAPEWGNFRFTVEVKKKRENSTLHLILFESSAMDGSRQYELPVVLY